MYLTYLKSLPKDGISNISATAIANDLELNDVQVRKDLAAVGEGGRPKIGYVINELINEIEAYLGYKNYDSAVLVGISNLGRALLNYEGFPKQNMNIVVAFDIDDKMVGTKINGKHVLSVQRLENLCSRMKIKLGIITVPDYEAQQICDSLVRAGVIAIWNFTPAKLHAPDNVMILDEQFGESLSELLRHIAES
jgi:redox-sensing transcriptional repressor